MSTGFLLTLSILLTIPLWCLVHDVQSIADSLDEITYQLTLMILNEPDDLDEEGE